MAILRRPPDQHCFRKALVLAAGFFLCACDDDRGPVSEDLFGTWVWSREVEGGEVILDITDDDMIAKVGSSGWPDCPDGIICTHYGIRKLRFEPDGTMHYMYNVHTSSDYQYPGTWTVEDDVVSLTFSERYSCAHPGDSDSEERAGLFRYRLEGGDLWVSVRSFSPASPFFAETPENPELWIVYRKITLEEYDNRYMIRICQGATDDDCHPGCFPERYGSRE